METGCFLDSTQAAMSIEMTNSNFLTGTPRPSHRLRNSEKNSIPEEQSQSPPYFPQFDTSKIQLSSIKDFDSLRTNVCLRELGAPAGTGMPGGARCPLYRASGPEATSSPLGCNLLLKLSL